MQSLLKPARAGVFLAIVSVWVHSRFGGSLSSLELNLLIAASVIGGYMALNIGANDVANNVGPAVGSFALSLTAAIAIAAVFEAGGALIAGGNVVNTVKNGIIDTGGIASHQTYVWAMMGALLGGAVWLNVATWLGAPVSTTHSIVGGVMGAGIAAAGWNVVNWGSMGAIASSWVISPLMGGLIAALLMMNLNKRVFYKDDILQSAARVVPEMLALMAYAFSTYLVIKGLKNLYKFNFWEASLIGLAIAAAVYFWARPRIEKRLASLDVTRDDVNELFTWPLIFAAALLSFSHGSNDVANAIGPLAGIYEALVHDSVAGKVAIPLWIMIIGAIGLSVGLALFGPKLIRTVGSEITELDRTRAFCIALSAAITVIIASQLGLPVSTTHVALGAVFGVGFLREYLDSRLGNAIEEVLRAHGPQGHFELENQLHQFYDAHADHKKHVIEELKKMAKSGVLTKDESKRLRKLFRRKLVKRQMFLRIVAAWLITVPISAALAAGFFFMLRGMMLP